MHPFEYWVLHSPKLGKFVIHILIFVLFARAMNLYWKVLFASPDSNCQGQWNFQSKSVYSGGSLPPCIIRTTINMMEPNDYQQQNNWTRVQKRYENTPPSFEAVNLRACFIQPRQGRAKLSWEAQPTSIGSEALRCSNFIPHLKHVLKWHSIELDLIAEQVLICIFSWRLPLYI